MASSDVDDYELEKIRAEIQQEKQMKEMLEQSARELRITVEELEKRYDSIESEGNEWKTRFETQEEMNQQLERQIIMLQDKVEEAKRNLKDADLVQLYQLKKFQAIRDEEAKRAKMKVQPTRAVVDGKVERSGMDTPKSKSTGITINISVSPQGTPRCTVDKKGQGHALSGDESAGKTPRDMKSFDDLSDANPSMVRSMEKEKQTLYNQLRDLEWRLDHESKAYHKAHDERKQYVVEINSTKGNIEGNKARQRAAVTLEQREVVEISRSPRLMGYSDRHRQRVERKNSKNMGGNVSTRSDQSDQPSSHVSYTSPNSNIPEDQRILDPRRGPIKRTAADIKVNFSLRMTYVYILSTLPSAIHLFAATGILNDWNYQNPQRDSIEWWIDSFVDCYRLGPYNGELKNIIAYIQLVVGIATLLIHLLKLLKYRPIMYYLFLALYVCTQLRHLVFSSGVFVIGYLFTHMMIYMILVMYYETRIRKLIL